MQETGVIPREDPLEEAWQPTPVFFPGESYWQRSLEGYSPWVAVRHDWSDLARTHVLTVEEIRTQKCGSAEGRPIEDTIEELNWRIDQLKKVSNCRPRVEASGEPNLPKPGSEQSSLQNYEKRNCLSHKDFGIFLWQSSQTGTTEEWYFAMIWFLQASKRNWLCWFNVSRNCCDDQYLFIVYPLCLGPCMALCIKQCSCLWGSFCPW